MLKLVQIYCFNLKRFSPDDRETKPKENTLANQIRHLQLHEPIRTRTKRGKTCVSKPQLVLEKDNTLGNHIKHRQLNGPITTRRKRGKTCVSKSQLGLENEMYWTITFDTHHLMNQSEHEESAGKRV